MKNVIIFEAELEIVSPLLHLTSHFGGFVKITGHLLGYV